MKLIDILDATPIPVAYRIAFLTNFWREPLLRRMEREFGLIRPELTTLICLHFRSGIIAKDICEITEQPSNTVSRAVISLSNQGLITRTRDPDDARRMTLDITADGREVYDQLMEIFSEAEQAMLAGLTKAEVKTLTQLLDKLARDVERWSSHASNWQ
jgi:DNA-binding MarR family transcriptional regulator